MIEALRRLLVRLLVGERLVTQRDVNRIRLEWQEWEVTLTSLLEKLSMWSARQAKREKRQIEADLTVAPPQPQEEPDIQPHTHYDRKAHKAALRRQAFGGGAVRSPGDEP